MLAQLQEQLAKHIQTVGTREIEISEDIRDYCQVENQSEIGARLAVYQNNYYAALIDILQDTYPTIHKLTGQEFFKMLAREYVRVSPPTTPLLFEYGGSLPEFVENFPPLTNFVYMPDVARLDWMRHCAYYARNENSLSTEVFLQYDPVQLGKAILKLHPSSHMLVSSYAIYSIWESNLHATGQDTAEQIDAIAGESVLVFRTNEGIQTLNTSVPTIVFLQNLQSGQRLEQALEAGMDADSNFNASSAFNFLINSGLCTEIELAQ